MYFMDGPLRCVTHIVFFERKSGRKIFFFALVVCLGCSLKNKKFKTQVILAKVTEKVRTFITTETELIAGNVNQA